MRKSLVALTFLLACLFCGWFGFWSGYTEMFSEHLDRQYANDVARLITERRLLRCLEEDPSKAMENLRVDLKMQRQIAMLTAPPLDWTDRLRLVMEPRALWSLMLQQREQRVDRFRYAGLVQNEGYPSSCTRLGASSPQSIEEQNGDGS